MSYDGINEPKDIKIVCSTQHLESITIEQIREQVEEIIRDEISEYDLSKTKFLINPTGRFVIGAPDGDTGVTGRKIIVDTYGIMHRMGEEHLAAKTAPKVDRSAAYMSRYLAKNIVSSGKADNCTVQLGYAIGVVEPTSVYVYADGKVRTDFTNWIIG